MFGVRRRAVLRSVHLLGTSLEIGSPLPEALALVSRMAEGGRLCNAWAHVRERVEAGDTLSDTLRIHPAFPAGLAALTEIGERTGELPRALLAAAGDCRFDPSVGPRREPVRTPLLGPVPRIGMSIVRQAGKSGAAAIRLTAAAYCALTGYRSLLGVIEANIERKTFTIRQHGGTPSFDASQVFPPTNTLRGIQQALRDYFPDEVCVETPPTMRVEYQTAGSWANVMQIPGHISGPMIRYYLYRSGIPYWSRHAYTTSTLVMELDGVEQRHPITYSPAPEWTTLEIGVPQRAASAA